MKYRFARAAALAFTLLLAPAVFSAEYPELVRLDTGDLAFLQLQEDIRRFNLAQARGESGPPLVVYSYRTRTGDDLFSLASRLNLPYETLATLNGISRPEALRHGLDILVPNLPGLFVPERSSTDLDRLMLAWRVEPTDTVVVDRSGSRESYRFFPNARFHPVERAYFLGILFRFPLPAGLVTSGYGQRLHPVYGHRHFHGGIDIAAAVGTEVLAAAGGTVREAGFDEVLGRFIVLEHFGGFRTVYGHLESIHVQLNADVLSGAVIGTVGSTGLSTGPHLHFEIREGTASKDPEHLLFRTTR